MKISTFVRAAIGTCAFALASQASAAVIYEFNSAGKLSGAKGVSVLGKLYDVTFVDGTCASIFDNCDDASDFTFRNETDVRAAATALSSQVFIDTSVGSFDNVADKVSGCFNVRVCSTFIPYSLNGTLVVNTARLLNYYGENEALDAIGVTPLSRANDFSNNSSANFARFQVSAANVPEPSSIALMGLAFAGLAFSRRRKS